MNIASALEVLELTDPFNEDELKKAYRAKALEYHPDRNCETLEAHWNMIELNQAHNLVLASLRQKERHLGSTAENTKEQKDYDLYKQAMTSFRRVHPTAWIKTSEAGLFDRSGNVERLPVTAGVLEALASISSAFSGFSQLVNDFPESIWKADSKAKLTELEKMAKRYRTMFENAKRERMGKASSTKKE
jgi:hypothetical protein